MKALKQIILDLSPFWVIQKIYKHRDKNANHTFIRNINLDVNNKHQKRVLISYVTESLKTDFLKNEKNTRARECSVIIKNFIERGFCVDITDSLNNVSFKNIKYDVIFGFGEAFFNACKENLSAKRILYLTERHPDFSHKKEGERIAYYFERHAKKIPFNRSGLYYKKEHFDFSEFVIYVGNEGDYPFSDKTCFPIKVTGLKNLRFDLKNRNLSVSKNNFLWLGSRGAIHKGADILIDIFKELPNNKLYLAGLSEFDRKALPKFRNYKNIIDLGFVEAGSDAFLNLVYDCSFIIFPSCSEALATSVITGMNHGLIPIISHETGFIIEGGIGYFLNDYHIPQVKETILNVLRLTEDELKIKQELLMNYSIQTYSIENFNITFNDILNKILTNS